MFYLNLDNLQAYSLGATMLGSGGGGNTNILFDLIKYLMHTHGRVKVIKINELNHDDLVVPLAFVGAPLIGIEKIPNTRIFEDIYQKIKADYPNRNIILMPAQTGLSREIPKRHAGRKSPGSICRKKSRRICLRGMR